METVVVFTWERNLLWKTDCWRDWHASQDCPHTHEMYGSEITASPKNNLRRTCMSVNYSQRNAARLKTPQLYSWETPSVRQPDETKTSPNSILNKDRHISKIRRRQNTNNSCWNKPVSENHMRKIRLFLRDSLREKTDLLNCTPSEMSTSPKSPRYHKKQVCTDYPSWGR